MVEIAERHPESRAKVIAHLARSFPPVEKSVARLVTSRAKDVHEHLQVLTKRKVDFPNEYNELSREVLIREWSTKQ
jgi:hypothetical protein